jgi:hypothetical protein
VWFPGLPAIIKELLKKEGIVRRSSGVESEGKGESSSRRAATKDGWNREREAGLFVHAAGAPLGKG